jgi:hypothetical protein
VLRNVWNRRTRELGNILFRAAQLDQWGFRMNIYVRSMDKGRKKKVKEFKVGHGLWILGTVNAILMGILLLWMLGYVRFDMD